MTDKKKATPETNSTEKKERVYRSKEERIAILEKKIEVLKGQIAKHEMKIEAIKNPKPRSGQTSSMKSIITKAKESGMTPEEIAEKLGISL